MSSTRRVTYFEARRNRRSTSPVWTYVINVGRFKKNLAFEVSETKETWTLDVLDRREAMVDGL